jgi:hypothetical protein
MRVSIRLATLTDADDIAALTAQLGYEVEDVHAKTQHAFTKSLGPPPGGDLTRFVPRIPGGPTDGHSD